jgi:hypothetical protein
MAHRIAVTEVGRSLILAFFEDFLRDLGEAFAISAV